VHTSISGAPAAPPPLEAFSTTELPSDLELLSTPARPLYTTGAPFPETFGGLLAALHADPAAERLAATLLPYLREFGPMIRRAPLHWNLDVGEQPLPLLQRPERAITVEDLLRLRPAELLHGLAHALHPRNHLEHALRANVLQAAAAHTWGSVRVATWNVGGLPEWLGPVTSPLTRFSRRRFAEIGHRLAAAACHVVALQELWDSSTDEIIRTSRFPYMAPGSFSPGLFGRSGLVMLSRFPVLESEERSFTARVGVERFVRKGMLRALIELENGHPCYFYTGHFVSPPEPATRSLLAEHQARTVRTRQFDELAGFIASGKPGIPVVVLGGMNCAPGDPEYHHLRQILRLNVDAERWRFSPVPRPTFDPIGNTWAAGYLEYPAALDHIWVPESGNRLPLLNSTILQTAPDFRKRHLSDHYMLESSITWLNSR